MKRSELEYISTGPYLVIHENDSGDVIASFNVEALAHAVRDFWCYDGEETPWSRAIYDVHGRQVALEIKLDRPHYVFDMTREAMKVTQFLPDARPLGLLLEAALDAGAEP